MAEPWRWELYDPIDDETYVLHINPVEGGTPEQEKTMTTKATTGGKTLLFEGEDAPTSFEVSGSILEEDHLAELQRWFAKRHQVRLTDDLGRVFWIYIYYLGPKRVRRSSRPWFHQYTLRYYELDIPA